MAATPRVYINGKLFDKADAKISVYDHGLLYGDGVFEGIRVYSGKVFRLKEHVERLYESARAIHLEIPIGREQMTEAVLDTVKANNKVDGYIRLVVTRGGGTLGLDIRKTSDPQVIVIVDDISLYPPEHQRPVAADDLGEGGPVTGLHELREQLAVRQLRRRRSADDLPQLPDDGL